MGAWTGVRRDGEEGFLLIGALIAVFLLLLVLGVAAPTVARQLRRDRELEAQHRGDQYVQAIRLYYKKFGHYPGTMEQLEKSNNVRFLRQKYVDPMTGKADWRLIHVGEQKTTTKGFFGQPLAGIASAGLGSAAGLASPGGTGSSPSAFGSSSSGSGLGGSGSTGLGGSSGSGLGGSSLGGSGSTGGGTLGAGTSSAGGSNGISSQSATSFTGSGAPFVGVGSAATGDSIVVLNEQTTYPTWEFIYDPRTEQAKGKVNILGGGVSSASATGLGTASGLSSGVGATPGGTSPASTTPTSPTAPPQ